MTDQELRDLIASNAVAIAELRKSQEETNRQIKQTDQRLGKQIGALGNKFGSFAEGMALPSMSKLFLENFGMDSFAARQKRKANGSTLELEAFAYGELDRPVAFIVEIKSHLRQEDIDQVLKTIESFPRFFPDHAHRAVYGVIAGVDIDDTARNRALKEGLYLARLSEDTFKLQVPRNFKPKAFGPFKNGEKNGRSVDGKRRKK